MIEFKDTVLDFVIVHKSAPRCQNVPLAHQSFETGAVQNVYYKQIWQKVQYELFKNGHSICF